MMDVQIKTHWLFWKEDKQKQKIKRKEKTEMGKMSGQSVIDVIKASLNDLNVFLHLQKIKKVITLQPICLKHICQQFPQKTQN